MRLISFGVSGCFPCYEKLNTLPGIGRILAMIITMEVGDIKRFPTPGDFASYCHAVDSKRMGAESDRLDQWTQRA